MDDFEFDKPRRASVIDMAKEILSMHDELEYLRVVEARYEELQRDYNELLNQSLHHSQVMTGNILKMCMTPGVVEALAATKEK